VKWNKKNLDIASFRLFPRIVDERSREQYEKTIYATPYRKKPIVNETECQQDLKSIRPTWDDDYEILMIILSHQALILFLINYKPSVLFPIQDWTLFVAYNQLWSPSGIAYF